MQMKTLIVLGAALGVAACTNAHQPAGAFLDEGQFGNATMQNTRAMKSCVGRPKGYILAEPVVVMNPVSPKSPGADSSVYRQGKVRCSGNLNGKYAEVIFEEYVDSATEVVETNTGGLAEIAGAAGG